MEESLRQQILAAFPHSPVDIRTYSPMAFAFLGDAVYSLVVRTMVISKGNRQAEKLHNETSLLVRASTQAAIGESIQDLLTEEERTIYKRGKTPIQPTMPGAPPMRTTRRLRGWNVCAATSICRTEQAACWTCSGRAWTGPASSENRKKEEHEQTGTE